MFNILKCSVTDLYASVSNKLKPKHIRLSKIIIITTTTTIIMTIIAFKGAIRDFFTISSQRRELSPTRTVKWSGRNRVQITCNTSSTYHVQVSCYVPLGTKGQLSY